MIFRAIACFGIVLALGVSPAAAQNAPPVPLYPGTPPRTYEQQPLPPAPATPDIAAVPSAARTPPPLPRDDDSQRPPTAIGAAASPPPAPRAAPDAPAADRVFCTQPISARVVDRDNVPDKYRPFIGIWSDASWTPQLCAALIVENVNPDGTATIVYAFGPMAGGRAAGGGVLHGTGIIRDGELRFQNSDGSQYVFRPLYSDLDGKYTTPQGQTYGAIFKRTM
jgi:hypothetical protein